jgi:glycerophosphoryl diester phosphodiesterase
MMPLRLMGHRGACAERPENTMLSFERAVEIGVDVLETDIHMTADGHIVASHDDSGEREAGVAQLICESSWQQLQSWDAGHNFAAADGSHPYRGQGLRVPELAELLERFPDMALNIDIKQRTPAMVAPLLELLAAHDGEERVTLASFHHTVLQELRRGGWRGSMVCGRREVMLLLVAPRVIARQLGVHGDTAQLPLRAGPFDLASPRFIERCHSLGLRIDYWTVNDPAVADMLLERGADGIISDDPAALLPVFERHRARSSA